jgi:cyclopropane-fatty-acyl-phospholipid synthase
MGNITSVKDLTRHLNKGETNKESSFISQWLRKAVIKQLSKLNHGQLTLIEGETKTVFNSQDDSGLCAEIEILNYQFYWFIAFGGGVGAGEAYISHYWQSPDLTKVIQLFAVNQSVMDSMEGGIAKLTAPMKKMFHRLNKNTQQGSKSNIVAHYDLGNEFFKLFLDPTMMYSSGIFYQDDDSMEQASINKLERICQRLKLSESDHVVEIGTGWGGFAIYAAKKYGCHVTTTTISDEQYDYAKAQISLAGVDDKVTLLKQDYRKLTGKFDKLVSIEMIEAVGHHYFDTFFNKCGQLLKDDGEMLLQAITITDQRFDQAKTDVDFIKRYIFPGSCIPSVNAISQSVTRSSQLRLTNMDDFGMHYAKTLNTWCQAFFDNIEAVKAQGFDDAFIRMWQYYLCYCEGGFREQVISATQLHFVKPMARLNMALHPIEA